MAGGDLSERFEVKSKDEDIEEEEFQHIRMCYPWILTTTQAITMKLASPYP